MGGSGGNTFPLRGAPCRVSDIGRPGKRGQIDHARPSLSDGEIGTEKPTPSPDAEKNRRFCGLGVGHGFPKMKRSTCDKPITAWNGWACLISYNSSHQRKCGIKERSPNSPKFRDLAWLHTANDQLTRLTSTLLAIGVSRANQYEYSTITKSVRPHYQIRFR